MKEKEIIHKGAWGITETLCGLRTNKGDVRVAYYTDEPTCKRCLEIMKIRKEAIEEYYENKKRKAKE